MSLLNEEQPKSKQLSEKDVKVQKFDAYLRQNKDTIVRALPKHITMERMAFLAVSTFSTTPKLQLCKPGSILTSIVTASKLGLEIGVQGQCYLVPYKQTCTLIVGWKGLVELMNRSGRGHVSTGAVYEGDYFDYQLGTGAYLHHKQGDKHGLNPHDITHAYSIGYSKGSEHPIIEVYSKRRVELHRDNVNKVGANHYSYDHFEMYAKKVALLQVIKYLPQSVEMSNAMEVNLASENGQGATIEGDYVTVMPEDDLPPVEEKPQKKNVVGSQSNASKKTVSSKPRRPDAEKDTAPSGPSFAMIMTDINNASSSEEIDRLVTDEAIAHLPADPNKEKDNNQQEDIRAAAEQAKQRMFGD